MIERGPLAKEWPALVRESLATVLAGCHEHPGRAVCLSVTAGGPEDGGVAIQGPVRSGDPSLVEVGSLPAIVAHFGFIGEKRSHLVSEELVVARRARMGRSDPKRYGTFRFGRRVIGCPVPFTSSALVERGIRGA